MTPKKPGTERTYHVASEFIAARRWVADREPDLVDEILLGYFNPTTGASMDGGIQFLVVGGKVTPRLELFEDSWAALAELPELVAALAALDEKRLGRLPTIGDVLTMLDRLGFVRQVPEPQVTKRKAARR